MTTTERLNWRPIRNFANAEAEKLGHTLEPWTDHSRPHHPMKMAMCATCYGCCWVDRVEVYGYRAGGRLLKYQCGTHEAAGTLPANGTVAANGTSPEANES